MCKYRAGAEGTDKMDLLSVLVVLALQQAHRSFLGWTLWVDQMPLGALLPFLHVHPSLCVLCF